MSEFVLTKSRVQFIRVNEVLSLISDNKVISFPLYFSGAFTENVSQMEPLPQTPSMVNGENGESLLEEFGKMERRDLTAVKNVVLDYNGERGVVTVQREFEQIFYF